MTDKIRDEACPFCGEDMHIDIELYKDYIEEEIYDCHCRKCDNYFKMIVEKEIVGRRFYNENGEEI